MSAVAGPHLATGGRALITGGTSGIGAAFARELAARGHDLVLVARDEARLASTAADLSQRYGVEVQTLRADLATDTDLRTVAARLADPDRPIDVLVNNAGFAVHHRLTDPDTAPHEHAIAVMITAVLVLGGAAGAAMRERGHGAIVNVSSTAGLMTMGSYSAIKAWATSYSQGLAVELAGTGVTVTALLPGWVRTEFHQRAGIRTGKIPDWLWLDPDVLVAGAADDAVRGRVLSIPTKRYRLLAVALRHAPAALIRKVSGAISSSRRR